MTDLDYIKEGRVRADFVVERQDGHLRFRIEGAVPLGSERPPPAEPVLRDLPEVPATERPLLLRVPEAAELLGLGRTKVYELVNTGEIPTVRIGRSLRIPYRQLRDWVDEKARESQRPDRLTGSW